MSAKPKEAFANEAALCQCFIDSLRALDGWTVYPETAGFDILAVYKTGHQLGVEAKLKLNAKVADQILPGDDASHEFCGPDFRAVIVPGTTEANAGIAKMLCVLGVMVWAPHEEWMSGHKPEWSFQSAFGRHNHAAYDSDEYTAEQQRDQWIKLGLNALAWHDWNPPKRCVLPEIVPLVAAGVPAPLRLTPWKIGALRVMADIEVDGFVTAKSVRAHGVDPRRFCAADGWLAPLGGGKWGRGTIPAFDQQHPEAYAELLAKARAKRAA